MVNYQEARVKLTKAIKQIKICTKNILFLTTRQTTAIRNVFANNMSTDLKLSKAQISKIIQSSGFFGSWLGHLGKKSLANIAIPLARDNLLGLVSNLISNAINKFERKITGKRAVSVRKGFTLFILNEDMNDIVKIIKSLEHSGVLMDGVTETVKHEIKKQGGRFLGELLASLAASLVQPVIS